MPMKTGIALLTAAAIAVSAGSAAVLSAEAKRAVVDFSADKDKKKGVEEHKKVLQEHKQGNQGGGKKGGAQFEFQKKKGGQQSGGKVEFEKKQSSQQSGGQHKNVTGKRLHGLSQGHGQTSVRGRNFSTWRGAHYRRRYHDRWVTFVPLTALAVIVIAGERFYPYAYIDAPEDYCGGYTEDGCELRWREVDTIDGDLVGQCVAYCPWQD